MRVKGKRRKRERGERGEGERIVKVYLKKNQ